MKWVTEKLYCEIRKRSYPEHEVEEMQAMGKRNAYIDYCKGVLAFCVVLCHIIEYYSFGVFEYTNNIIFSFLNVFYMPCFFLISGYLFYESVRKYNCKDVIKRKCRLIGYPLIIWGIIKTMTCLALGELNYKEINLNSVYNCITTIWFLKTLLFIFIISAFMYAAQNIITKMVVLLLSCIVLFYSKLGIGSVLAMGIPFACGYGTKFLENKTFYIKHKKYLILLCGILFAASLSFGGKDAKYISIEHLISRSADTLLLIKSGVLRWIVAITGAVVFLVVCKWIFKNSRANKAKELFIQLGKKSLELYLIQMILVEKVFFRVYHKVCVLAGGKNLLCVNEYLFSFCIAPILGGGYFAT